MSDEGKKGVVIGRAIKRSEEREKIERGQGGSTTSFNDERLKAKNANLGIAAASTIERV